MTQLQVAGLVLAAGAGRRYGRPKALVTYEGRLLVDRAVATLVAGGCGPVVVVLGAAAHQVRSASQLVGATAVDNPAWETGMGSSVRAGLAALASTGAAATVVLLVDLPGVTAEAVRRVAALASPDALAMAGYGPAARAGQPARGDRRGHPVLLGRAHWPGVAQRAVGDAGARPYLRQHWSTVQVVWCGDVADDRDLDTPDDHPGDPPGDRPGETLAPGC